MFEIEGNRNLYIYIFIILLLGTILYLPASFSRDLHWNEEIKYVEIAKEMYDSGEWLVPHFGGDFYTHKPPFYFWFLNLGRMIFGSYSVTAVVLASAVPGILIALLTFYFGAKIFDKKYGFTAALILLISFYFFALSITVRMDHLMGMFILSAIISFYFGYNSEDINRKRKYYYLIFVFMALATWIKGPAGFLVPLVVIPVFILSEKNYSEFKKIQFGKGLLLFISIMLLWIIPSVISGGREYAYELLIIQTFGRAVNSFAHQRPFYYYLETFSGTFLPWSFFLYSSFIYYLRSRKNAPKFIKFLVVWFVSAFILFSVISGKLDIYLLPIYPAGALLTAYLFRQVREKKASSFYIVVPAVLTLVLLGIAAFFIPEEAEGIAVRSLLLPTITVWVLGAFICIYLILKKNTKYIYHLVLITFSVFLFNFSISVAPAFSDSYTVKPAALYLKKLKGLEYNNIGVYKFEGDTEALNIYTDFWPEAVENVEDLSLYLAKPNSALMIEKEKWDSLENIIELKGKFKVIEVSNNYLVIIR